MRSAMSEVIKDAISKQNGCIDDYDSVFRMMDRIIELDYQLRREGVLRLMDSALEMADLVDDTEDMRITDYCYSNLQGMSRLLSALLSLIFNGTDFQQIEDIGIIRYYAGNFQGRDALIACMIIVGAIGIGMSWTPFILRQNMLAMLPAEVENQYIRTRILEDLDKEF